LNEVLGAIAAGTLPRPGFALQDGLVALTSKRQDFGGSYAEASAAVIEFYLFERARHTVFRMHCSTASAPGTTVDDR
jgi:hypothetical protein